MYKRQEEGCAVSKEILEYGGLGHTLGLWAKDSKVIEAWFLEKPANRIVVNGPTSQGAVGYSTNLVVSMSLGCGPQAGNITSDNITARHLINIKRAAFPRRDWEAVWARDHARAAQLGGEKAPRGSGLEGDPALRAGRTNAPSVLPRSTDEPRSNWTGNPPVFPRAEAPRPEGGPARSAPRFTEARAVEPAPARSSATAVAPPPPPPVVRAIAPPPRAVRAASEGAQPALERQALAAGPYVGSSLTPHEIVGILAHAGSGCPLGPCRGCSHHDVQSGSCTA